MSDTAWDDAERLRRRQSALDDDRSLSGGIESYPACVVAKITTGSGSTQTFFTLEIQTVTGIEADGSPGTLTGTGSSIKAINLGATIPPAGVFVICHRTANRWVFRYG